MISNTIFYQVASFDIPDWFFSVDHSEQYEQPVELREPKLAWIEW